MIYPPTSSASLPPSYYQTQADALHDQWVNTLRDLRNVSEPSARQLYLEDLSSIYDQARNLAARDAAHIDGIRAVKLQHILQRPLEQHIAIAKHNDGTVMSDHRNSYSPNPNNSHS
jgi:hypothetical protein